MATDPKIATGDLKTPLLEMVRALDLHKIRYALIGGMATGYRGRPRVTEDLDFLLDIPQIVLPKLLEDLASVEFTFDAATVIREWVQEHMTTIAFHGVLVDWLKPVIPCYREVLDHASAETWHDTTVRIAAAEDLIVLKLLAFRSQDQADVSVLLGANPGQLDLERIRGSVGALADADDPRLQQFEEMVRAYYLPAP